MKRLALPAIVTLAGVLILWNLDLRLLWQDEANTAVVARNILRVGYPCGWDGRNFFPHESLRSISNPHHIITHQSWLQYYLLASSFLLLGVTTFTARLPCALIGIGTVWLTYRLARRLTGSQGQGLVASLLLVLSVPFLLHARQARYYAPAMFLTAALLLTYLAATTPGARRRQWVLFAAVGALLFHTHPLVFLAGMLGVGCHFLVFHLRSGRVKAFSLSLAFMALLTTPYLLPLLGYYSPKTVEDPRSEVLASGLSFYVPEFDLVFVPLPVLPLAVIPLAQSLRRRRRAGGKTADGSDSESGVLAREALPWMVFASTFAVVTILPLIRKPSFNFRYLVGLLPVASCILAHVLAWLWVRTRLGTLALAFVLVGTNLLSMPVQLVIGWGELPSVPLYRYFQYLTVQFQGPDEGVVEFLDRWARPDDWVTTTYGEMPIMFYTPLRVAFRRNRLTDPSPDDLPSGPDGPIRWVIERSGRERQYDWDHKRIAKGEDERYEGVELKAPDLRYGNIPEPGIQPFVVPDGQVPVKIFYYPSIRMIRTSPYPFPLTDYETEAEVFRSGAGWRIRYRASGRVLRERYLRAASLGVEMTDPDGKTLWRSPSNLAVGIGRESSLEEPIRQPPETFGLRFFLSYQYDLPFLGSRPSGPRRKALASPAPFHARPGVDRYRFRVAKHTPSSAEGDWDFSFLVGVQEEGNRGRFWAKLLGSEWDGSFGWNARAVIRPYVAVACPRSGERYVLRLAPGAVGGTEFKSRGLTFAPVEGLSEEIPLSAGCELRVGYDALGDGRHPELSKGPIEETALAPWS